MKLTPLLGASLVVAAGMMVTTSLSFGKPEYTKKEKKGCTTCHVSAKSKDLNDVGKCYSDKKKLDECVKK